MMSISDQQNEPEKTPSHFTFVKDSDLKLVAIVSFFVLLMVITFGVALFFSGLLSFPDIAGRQLEHFPIK